MAEVSGEGLLFDEFRPGTQPVQETSLSKVSTYIMCTLNIFLKINFLSNMDGPRDYTKSERERHISYITHMWNLIKK